MSDQRPRFIRLSIATLLTIATTAAVIPGLIGCFIAAEAHFREQAEKEFEQEQEAIVDRARTFEAAGDFWGCIAAAEQVLPQAKVYRWAQVHLRNCQDRLAAPELEQAKQQAAKGEFAQAIRDASQVSVGSSYYGEARQLIEQWSERILEIAESYYWQPVDQIDQALTIAGAIPSHSPTYEKAQAQMQEWQQTRHDNQQHWLTADQAIGQGQLDIALSEASQITDHPFWAPLRNRIVQIVQEKQLEQQHEEIWKTAERFLEAGETENAIATAYQLPDDFPWSERRQQIIAKAEAQQQRVALCQAVWLGFRSCH